MESLLFGVVVHDPLLGGLATMTLLAVAALAGAAPAWTAVRVNPVVALRTE